MMLTKRRLLLAICVLVVAKCSLSEPEFEAVGGGLMWKGVHYYPAESFATSQHTVSLGSTSDGDEIRGFADDPEYSYILRGLFLDQSLYVREDYQVQRHAAITAIYINSKRLALATSNISTLKQALSEAALGDEEACVVTNYMQLQAVSMSHNKSYVADDILGHIIFANQAWFYIPLLTDAKRRDVYLASANKPARLNCYKMESGYNALFNKLFYAGATFVLGDSDKD